MPLIYISNDIQALLIKVTNNFSMVSDKLYLQRADNWYDSDQLFAIAFYIVR